MSDDPIARNALRAAQGDAPPDVTRLVASVPDLMHEAARRRLSAASPSLAQLAASTLPRLAAATAIAVVAAGSIVAWERSGPGEAPTTSAKTFESVILEGRAERSDDVVFDALLAAGRSDG